MAHHGNMRSLKTNSMHNLRFKHLTKRTKTRLKLICTHKLMGWNYYYYNMTKRTKP